MSTQDAAPASLTIAKGTSELELDVSQLHALPSEQQELYLLTFVSELWRHVEAIPNDALGAHTASIKKETIKVLGLGTPSPSRVIRQSLGQIIASVFKRGSRALLFETMNDLLAIINAGKGDRDVGNKHAAVVSIGYIYAAAGDSAISLSSLVCASLIKLLKQTQSHAGLRGSIYRALGSVARGLGTSIDEPVARDIWKQARSAAANDKAGFVQRHACLCLRSLFSTSAYFVNSNDFESLKATVFKIIDHTITAVRHAAAVTLADALLAAYSDVDSAEAVPIVRKPKKSKKQQQPEGDEDIEIERSSSPLPSRPAVRLVLGLRELLKVLALQFTKSSTNNKGRAGLATCYRLVLQGLPEKVVEDRYATVADHFFTDLLNHPTIIFNRFRSLLTRKYVHVLLEQVVGAQLLSEGGQINASKWLLNDILKNYPQVIQERREPPKRALAAALRALSSLIRNLGAGACAFQDQCRETTLQVMQHPSYTVQIHAARCLRSLTEACPQQSLRSIDACLARLKKELEQSKDNRQSHARCIGYANALAAVISTSRQHPLYGSADSFSNTLGLAIDLLKASSSSELRLSAAQIQVAWTLIGGLMSLGPNFVKVHLNQLLLLWRNALPMPLTADNAAKRSQLELSFLSHVRECALGALLVFLEFNSSLLTHDSTKRISSMFHNSVLFLDSLPRNRQSEDLSNRLVAALQLHDFSIMLQRRILQCFIALLKVRHIDHREAMAQSDVLNLAMRAFTAPDNPLPKSLETSVASSASNFDRIWDHGDNWSFGVNGMVMNYELDLPSLKSQSIAQHHSLPLPFDNEIDSALSSPAGLAFEHDSIMLYRQFDSSVANYMSPATAVVNSGLVLFAVTLPLQSAKVQESAFEQLATVLTQPFQREPGKKAAMQINITSALLCSLVVANGETGFSLGKLAVPSVEKVFVEILRRHIGDPDPMLRNLAALAMGRLCNVCGSQFTNNEVKRLIDMIVANRDPNIRAGCALSLGYIHSLVGGMAASYHLKSIVGILLSLCSDTHPVVHFWALKGLMEVCDSAGLTFSSYATSTLGLLAQLYLSDNHSDEAALVATSNMELELPAPPLVGKCVDTVINVLGPDLQDVVKARQLILTLVDYFHRDDIALLRGQGSICLGHLSLYAPAHLPFTKYVLGLQDGLQSNDEILQQVAIEGLNSLVKRNAQEVVRVATSSLADNIWLRLDDMPGNLDLQAILRNWLSQTALVDTADWVSQCQTILSKARVKRDDKPQTVTTKSTAMPDLADEEVAGFAAAAAAAQGENPEIAVQGQEYLRWQTRDFAMSLLSELVSLVAGATLPEHVIPAEIALQSKVADIVRMAFSASTANVVQLRVWGLKIIDQVLRLFGRTPDPDFLEASLLEQYQAQIGSALTPAFAVDSSPELAAVAISVCATFVATGIATTVDRMGRIFKILVQGLENLASQSPQASLGELKGLSSNAQSMLKMSILSAWAQLILATNEQPYLEDIVKPYISKLAPLWLSALQEFAQLRFEPEISSSLGGDSLTEGLDERYAAFIREARLKYYQQNWLNIVDAVAILVDKDSESIFEALDNRAVSPKPQVNGTQSGGKEMSFREEPVAFFFILFGLAFEALVVQAREDPSQALAILQALKKILKPAVCGIAIYEDVVFNETTDTLDRLALTSTHDTQSVLVEISRNLSLNHVSANTDADRNEKLSDDIDQLFELTRIIVLVLTGLIPTLEDPPSPSSRMLNEDGVSLVQRSFQALVDVAEVFPSVIRADLHTCIIHCFCTILATGTCQAEVIPQLMPIFRTFVQDITRSTSRPLDGSSRFIRGCLFRFLMILSHAQRRENEFALTCAKNTLLSMTILLTSAGTVIPANDHLISRATSEFLDCLHDVGLAKVAANCLRSLLLARPKTPCDEAVARKLWPPLLAFIGNRDSEDPENVKPTVVQALTASVQTFSRAGRSAAITLMIPILLGLAAVPQPNGSKENMRKEVANRLLEMAAIDGVSFRSVIGGLDDEQRQFLQEILRSAGVGQKDSGQNGDSAEEEKRPAIALRMDF